MADVVADALGDEAAGLQAALAVARAKGGQRVRILPQIADNAWLIEAVGDAAAAAIVALYTSGDMGEQIEIPMGSASGYMAERHSRSRTIDAGLASGRTVDDIAREAGVTRRYVFWRRARLRQSTPDTRQLGLFDDRAA
jgi:hypothetical protein